MRAAQTRHTRHEIEAPWQPRLVFAAANVHLGQPRGSRRLSTSFTRIHRATPSAARTNAKRRARRAAVVLPFRRSAWKRRWRRRGGCGQGKTGAAELLPRYENHLLDAPRRLALDRIQHASAAIDAGEPFFAPNPYLTLQPQHLGRPAPDRRCQRSALGLWRRQRRYVAGRLRSLDGFHDLQLYPRIPGRHLSAERRNVSDHHRSIQRVAVDSRRAAGLDDLQHDPRSGLRTEYG